jgi:hypothetical protein
LAAASSCLIFSYCSRVRPEGTYSFAMIEAERAEGVIRCAKTNPVSRIASVRTYRSRSSARKHRICRQKCTFRCGHEGCRLPSEQSDNGQQNDSEAEARHDGSHSHL